MGNRPALRSTTWLAAIVCALFLLPSAPVANAARISVDLALVLAVDVSSSMNADEQAIQRAGYADALSDRTVVNAILSGPTGRIAVTYLEWAGPDEQAVTIPWRIIDSETGARRVAAELRAAPIMRGSGTSISAGLLYAAKLFEADGFETNRRVVDISGDGPNNLGPHIVPAREMVLAKGIVINGLPLMLQPAPTGYAVRPDLADYFRDCVIGGPGAFVFPANSTGGIAAAIRQKLVQEIAMRPARMIPVAAPPPDIRADCMIGQKEFYE